MQKLTQSSSDIEIAPARIDQPEARVDMPGTPAEVMIPERSVAAGASPLACELLQEARKQRREALITLSLLVAFMLVATASIHFARGWFEVVSGMAAPASIELVAVALSIAAIVQSHRRNTTIMRALNASCDVQDIPALIQTLLAPNLPVRRLAKLQLIRLLPQMRSSDVHLIGENERATLMRHLAVSPRDLARRDVNELFSRAAYRREIALHTAILKALEQVGGAKEQPLVERLAADRSMFTGTALVPEEIRSAARECLPFLQVRKQAELASAQLLRASSSHAASPGELLRPASTDNGDISQLLLPTGIPGQE